MFVIYLPLDIWFEMPDIVLALFHYESLFSNLPSTAKATGLRQ